MRNGKNLIRPNDSHFVCLFSLQSDERRKKLSRLVSYSGIDGVVTHVCNCCESNANTSFDIDIGSHENKCETTAAVPITTERMPSFHIIYFFCARQNKLLAKKWITRCEEKMLLLPPLSMTLFVAVFLSFLSFSWVDAISFTFYFIQSILDVRRCLIHSKLICGDVAPSNHSTLLFFDREKTQ